MPVKVLKIISEQSGPFSRTNNKVDIKLPAYIGYSDLSKTCLVVKLKLTKSDGTDLGLYDAVFNTGLDASCLIKNCSIESSNSGMIESIPASNVLTTNLNLLSRDFEDLEARRVYGYGETYSSTNSQQVGTLLKKKFHGTTSSAQESYLKIPLKNLFGIAKMKQFPNSMVGDLTIHIEFEDDLRVINKMFKQVKNFAMNVGNTSPSNTFTNPNSGIPPDSSAFWVGQPVIAYIDGLGNTKIPRVITSINYDTGTNKAEYTLDSSVAWSATTSNNFVTPGNSNVDDHALQYSVSEIDCVVYQWILSPKQQQSLNSKMRKGINLQFMTWKAERVNMPNIIANNTYNRQFDLEPNVVNVFGLMPHIPTTVNAASAQPLLSRFDSASSYRWRLNGVDTTNQDVKPLGWLYNDRLLATTSNGYMKVKNLNLNNLRAYNATNSEYDPAVLTSDPQSFIIPSPIPLSPEQQTIQLRLHQGDADSKSNKIFYLYKQVKEQMNLKGVKV